MPWQTTTEPERYLAAAGAFLRADPVANTVPLTVVAALRAQGAGPADPGAPVLGWWTDADADGGAVTGAFLLNPPYPLLLTAMPDAAVAALADVLAETGRPVAGVNASEAAAGAFAAAWAARTGAETVPFRAMRLHRLASLVPPDPPPPGRAVTAAAERRALLVDWYEAFGREIGEEGGGVERQVDDRLGYGGLLLWERDGEPVSLAGMTRQVAGAARVAPVYTPPAHRGRGYGAAATAAVARAALDAGAREVLLYTDLANPTSNRLYARLGFVGVDDQVVLRFA
jgi:RimJ/RimL family protein N-acetyltransferase